MMVSFESPHYLHGAWVLPVLVGGYVLSRRATARARRAAGLAGRADGEGPGWRGNLFRLRLGLQLLACAALVLALANPLPETPGRRPAGTAGPARLVFVVDVSSSMLAGDVLPDRLTLAKRVLAEAVKELHGEEAGIVAFAGNAQLYTPLTTDYDVLARACTSLSPNLVPRQGTALAGALALAAQVLQVRARQPRVLCVLSDGESHATRYEVVADSLRQAGIELYAIGIGTPEGANIMVSDPAGGGARLKRDRAGTPIRSRLREDNLRRIVQGRPDRYIRLDTWKTAATRLLREIHKLDPARAQVKTGSSPSALQLCLLTAFGLLLLALLLPPGRLI